MIADEPGGAAYLEPKTETKNFDAGIAHFVLIEWLLASEGTRGQRVIWGRLGAGAR